MKTKQDNKTKQVKWENFVFRFGQYKGKCLKRVIKKDPRYVIWCAENLKKDQGVYADALRSEVFPQ